MNGDMPHVPITTLAGIASLTDLLNQLPLPSPLPATTTKSLLYNGRIAEDVSCLLGCRDENLASQLAHSLNQVSTEHIELKDNLGSDEPEGDAPVLLQTLLARNPGIFREKNVLQQQMVPPYKITQNSMHSPAQSGNYQASAISPNPPSRFVSPQTGSSSRYMGQQNSPVPSPYTPQSPATGYIQPFPHQQPPSYNQHQQIQQVSVTSPMVPGGIRNIHEGKVSGQLAGASNHLSDRHGTEDYMNIVHRLSNEEGDSAMRNPSFPLRSPQSGCSPAGSDGTPKLGSRPPLILSPPPYVPSAREGGLDQKQQLQQRKKIPAVKEEKDMYDIVSSPNKDSTKLTLKLSRVKSNESDSAGDVVPGMDQTADSMDSELGFQQVPVLQQNLAARLQQQQISQQAGIVAGLHPPSSPYDEAELDALAEIERIEREAASEKCSKEVQDKDKPLKKRKQDSFPHETGTGGPGGPTGAPGSGSTGGGNAGKLTPQEATAAGNGASRPPLMIKRDRDGSGPAEDQIQRIIRHSKSGKNRISSGKSSKGGMDPAVWNELPPELLAEIESTMPLCERVKMNKRKRSTINEKPKYAEESSDDDFDPNGESARKKQRRDKDRAWEFEERERRGSGEHRKSGQRDSRRGSGSRYRDSSEEDSPPPPSISEVARKLKMKEKQKKRKVYEPKLTQEELMDSSTFKRFLTSIDNILENLEDVDFTTMADDDEIPQELLLGKHQLSELGSESAKIKAMNITGRISSDKLVKLLNILEKNIQDGSKLSTMMNHDHDVEDEEKLWRDLIMERVTKSADACLTALNIMTSAHMPKAVYIEDVIERVLQFTKFHLQNTLYPQYDPVYRVDPHGGGLLSSKAKRAKCSTHKQRVIVMLYNKVCDIVSNISELLEIQLLTDTTILQVSSMGITPFFVENVSELQLCAIKLVTAVFSRYEKHRQLILEEIFTSLARLPTSKRSLRNFRLNSSDEEGEPLYIQMVTALVLQLIQCVVHLPNDRDMFEECDKVDQDVLITNSYETAMRTAQNFLSVFLKKCGSKQGEEDYRPLFENFVQDLLSTVNKPEWPAAELLLSLLGRLLVHQFSNKQTEMALRVASLDYLGTVAARLRKDAVTSKMDQRSIDRILQQSPGNDETQQLQKALLDYLEDSADTDASLVFARKFYIAQWFRDTTTEAEKSMRNQNQKDDDSSDGPQHAKEIETTGEIMQRAEKRKKFLRNIIKTTPAHFATLKMNSDTVDYEDSCLIVRYLASMRPFAQSFDIYLTQILRVLGESAIAVRTKAMKCLSEVVAVDPSILARSDMQRGVHGRLMDNSTSVREAAVELLGRFVLSRPQLTEQYYDMLIERILDTGISVRKRVIKILRDICLEQPAFSKITEMCVKMIRRVNDEEGIKKLVNETFQKLWFTPTPAHDKETMTRKILNITDVVAACRDTGYDWFEQLLQNLLKSEEDASYKPAKKACVQLVDNLVEHILKYEESLAESKGVNSTRLVACITTLYLFSKIRAQLMVKHAMTMQPYLTTKCNTANDFMVICNVAKILELVVPLMEHPSETFLATIEEDLMKLIIKYGMTVVQHCVSCLGAVVNKVTHNYKFVWACFNRFYGALNKLKLQHHEDPNSTTLVANKPFLLRSLFTVGALARHFDFDLEEFKGSNKVVIKDKVLELLLYFTKHEDEEVKTKAIIGLGFLVIMHPSQMFAQEVKTLYNGILAESSSSINLKIQILKNLQTYLQEEDTRMQEADREWKKLSKQEDLKEMGDISSGMSSSIMQLYLKQVLEAFFHSQSSVRHFALNVIALTLNQGLIHPVQCVPYLIAMGTDPEPSMRNKADQQLVEIDKKYTGFIHMKAVAGMKMSYSLQQAINLSRKTIIRGFRQDETHSALCSHLFTMIRGNRQHRRAFLISLLNLFDDSAKTEVNMLLFIADNLACFPYQSQEEPLFIMHHIDITLSVSGSNLLQTFRELLLKEPRRKVKKEWKNTLDGRDEERMNCDSFRTDDEANSNTDDDSDNNDVVRRPKKAKKLAANSSDSESDLDDLNVDDVDKVMSLLPDNPMGLLDFANAVQGILLLLVLKQHLKNQYGFSDSKIQKYSPTESAKVYDKAVNRKHTVHFYPRQTLDFIANNMAHASLTNDVKRHIVRQYLDFKVLMEHLDPDEEDEEGEASVSANIRNKAINALLGGSGPLLGPSPRNQAGPETDDDDSDGDERTPGSSRKSRRAGDSLDPGRMSETVEAMDVIALCCPKYKDRPQIARVIQKTSSGYSIHWMAGSYSGPWAEAKKRDGRKLVPWVDTIKESDIIYKKIALTSNHKLSNKVVQTLRSLYAAREGGAS
ncbi:nipped-B-like protein A isoform X4 [Takifugu flavidus]|uniref:nipped-B-like protein A isoform X4 n=1 Tax=Takifugu flavidus TaxID=433684 RepID=UPI0025449435|nr:nipped-B-like protein A isoform X4 [Takifugu flavidus]